MRYLWIFLVALMVGCGVPEQKKRPEPEAPQLQVDIPLQPYVADFLKEAQKRNVETQIDALQSVSFTDEVLLNNPSVIAVCVYTIDTETNKFTKSRIKISTRYWEKLSLFSRRTTTYHELGHCLLARKHYDPWFWVDDEPYISIMATYLSHSDKDADSLPILLNELFHPEKYHDTALHGESLSEEADCFATENGEVACPIFTGGA